MGKTGKTCTEFEKQNLFDYRVTSLMPNEYLKYAFKELLFPII